MGRGITLSLQNLKAFAFCLQKIFVETGEVSMWLEALSNGDIRTCLEIAKEITVSPHIQLADLFKAFIAENAFDVPSAAVKRALVKGRFNMYPGSDNRFVRNVYSYDGEEVHSPLLGLRILSVLQEVHEQDSDNPFMEVKQLHEYFRSMGVEFRYVSGWLDTFLKAELCRSYDPTIVDAGQAQRVEITSSGMEHLRWGQMDRIYQKALMEVTPIYDRNVFNSIDSIYRSDDDRHARSDLSLRAFLEHLLQADAVDVAIPEHPAYECQRAIGSRLRSSIAQLNRKHGRKERAK